MISSNSVSKKGFVQKELKIALDILDEYPEFETFIIPVRLENCEPVNNNLKKLQWTDIYESYEKGFEKILKVFEPEIHFVNKQRCLESLVNIRRETTYVWGYFKNLKKYLKNEFSCKIRLSTYHKIEQDLIILSREGKLFNYSFKFMFKDYQFEQNNLHPYPKGKYEDILELSAKSISNELLPLIEIANES